MLIQILIDNPSSWFIPFGQQLKKELVDNGYNTKLLNDHDHVEEGDILCLLSCEKKFHNLNLCKHNLVVHESSLPKGKGWSPLTWQILEGKNQIQVTLFEATEKIDAGKIYKSEMIMLEGHELIDEIRKLQGEVTKNLIHHFVNNYPNVSGEEQIGEPTYYRKRTAEDSRIDIEKNIKEQFNLLRVVDNERYPAFFENDGKKYKIIINKI
jgi:methionyl-tRNA formyltransferase